MENDRKLKKKLSLNKHTLASLNDAQLTQIKGGYEYTSPKTYGTWCLVTTCFTTNPHTVTGC